MLFDNERHEGLVHNEWSQQQVEIVIKDIYDRAISNFDKTNLWPTDSNEDADISCNKSVYYGAAGNLWALEQISNFCNVSLPFDKNSLIQDIHKLYLDEPDTKEVVPSLFLGEAGILLLCYKYSQSDDVQERLYQIVKENMKNKTLEALWGAPGTMIAASYMCDWTKSDKWRNIFVENATYLIEELKMSIDKEENIWTQDMYDKKVQYIGAGHGYFGNIFAIFKKLDLLAEEDQEYMLANVSKMTNDLAKTEAKYVNWLPALSKKSEKYPLLQWCHGSPGVITALESFPCGKDKNLENLLVGAGELIWRAGPLKKGIALCHGTDGNGYAFLQLYKRTGESLWLERARAFAMHAMNQRNGRFTLFTGELGLALYLISCITQDSRFPFLDTLEIGF